MEESNRGSARVQLALPIRVRGISTTNKFFDETTETILISKHGFMTKIKNLVELDAEVHVVSTKKDVAGTFIVVWVNTRDQDGFHHLGLQLIEAEGDMWEVHFPDSQGPEGEASTEAWLECLRCHQKQLGTVPLTELEYLDKGVHVARPCDKCKSTTAWEFAVEDRAATASPPAAGPAAQGVIAPYESVFDEPAPAPAKPAGERPPGPDPRGRRRAALKLTLKVLRELYGTTVEDICETINVSRNGAYFLTGQNYHVGETLKVHLPYKKGSLNLPVLANVVRQDSSKGSFYHAVAVHMEEAVFIPGLEDPNEPSPTAQKKADQRSRSRVPLKFPIKVTRQIQGKAVEDFGETINISRTGAFFRTSQNYKVGELVEIIMPYKKGEMAIPVSARVVRQQELKDSVENGVAIAMGDAIKSS